MISLIHLTKRYGRLTAVNDVSLEIPAGEIFGFLGPNGAGKTTTIKMMAGILQPTDGTIIIDGKDLAEDPVGAKQVTGFIPDRGFLYEKLTGFECLQFVASLYSMDQGRMEARIKELVALFEMDEWEPKVIVVDEPMVGLDPKGARLVKGLLKSLANEGVSIFMSTHTLALAEEVCDRIGIIHEGCLIAVGTASELRQKAGAEERNLEAVFLKLTEDPQGVETGVQR